MIGCGAGRAARRRLPRNQGTRVDADRRAGRPISLGRPPVGAAGAAGRHIARTGGFTSFERRLGSVRFWPSS